MQPIRRASAAAVLLATVAVAATSAAAPAQTPPDVDRFPYSGTPQTWAVPAGVTRATFELWGAAGGGSGPGGSAGGGGGFVHAQLAVTPGERLTIVVGGRGGAAGAPEASAGGFNGGGSGPASRGALSAGGGGGASVVRRGGGLDDLLLVAGGGGGGGGNATSAGGGGAGGAGGGLVGGNGTSPGTAAGGGGGFADGNGGTGGDRGGDPTATPGVPGSPSLLGVGGAGGLGADVAGNGGGGGGGWIGGGGGGGGAAGSASTNKGGGGGGGGGQSYVGDRAQDAVQLPGVRDGDGLVTVTYELLRPAVRVAPSLQGPGVSGVFGYHLVCDPGTWTETPTFAFAWLRDGQPIAGQTATRLDPTDADAGREIACEVTASSVGGSTAVRTAAVRYGVRPPAPPPAPPEQYGFAAPPSIAGKVAVGSTLTCSGGVFQGAVARVEHAWLRDGAPLTGATGATRRVVAADAGRALQCSATAVRAGGVRVVALSPVVVGPPRVTPLTRSTTARRGVASLGIFCVAASTCRVTATATAARGRRTVLARAVAARVRADAIGSLALRLTPAGRAALRATGARGLALRLTLAPRDGANVVTTVRLLRG